jgi:flagellar assembly protein FliH
MTENKDEFENWSIPELSESNQAPVEGNTLFGKPATWYNNRDKAIEEVEVEDQPKPLTLDDIEAIRQAAYEDGFAEGKDAGFTQGLEEGKLAGMEAGHSEGLAQGLQEGLAQGAEQIEQQVAMWQTLLDRLHNPLEKLDENTEYQLVRLATTLAEQITRCEIQTSPQIILQALKQSVDALPISEQKLIINLHPEDLVFVQNAYSQEQCIQRGWDLQAEPTLMRGDCQINTKVSSVEFTFNSRIDQVLKNFFKENHQQLPKKNDDSDLTNDQPMPPPNVPENDNNAEAVSDTPDIAAPANE